MWPHGFVLLILAGASLAACSGSMGSGSAMPQTLSSPNFGVNPTPAPSPLSATAVLTYGDNANFQELPSIGGFGGAIAFPTAGPATPAPSKAGKSPTPEAAPTAVEIAIGVTLWVHKPEDGPDLNLESGKGKKRHGREHPARALAYIELLPTHDATLTSYPRIAIDIPRDIAAEYRDGEFGIALWDSGEKDNVYRLAVEAIDTSATPPPTAPPAHATGAATSTAAPTTPPPGVTIPPLFTPTPTASPTRLPNGQLPTAGPSNGPHATAAPTLPPQRVLFFGTPVTLHLLANRPAIFAVYALPEPAVTPTPKASGSPSAGASPAATTASLVQPQTLVSTPQPQPQRSAQ
jgi:hypothetical protein